MRMITTINEWRRHNEEVHTNPGVNFENSALDRTSAFSLGEEIRVAIGNVFPDSYLAVTVSDAIHPTIHIHFALGRDASEWTNGIIENDPAGQRIIVDLSRRPLSVTSGTAGSVLVNPPAGSHLAYGRARAQWRNFKAEPGAIPAKIGGFFSRLRGTLAANVDNMQPKHADLVRRKLGL